MIDAAKRIIEGLDRGVETLFIMGPTASGKSALAMNVAEFLPIEIISADSMQAYREMDIGTAKPSLEEQEREAHHLIDFLDISQPLDVFRYVDMANDAICEIRGRGALPVVVGGTGLYLRALIYGLDPLPADPVLRGELDSLYDSEEGFIELKALMSEIDLPDFERWSQDRRRLIRALEVFRITGKPITELQKRWPGEPIIPVKAWRLAPERSLIREKIAVRTDVMLDAGWVEETRGLLKKGLLDAPTARQAIGYPVIAKYIAGEIDGDAMREGIVNATRQYARRQDSWFKNKHPEASVILPALSLPKGEPVSRLEVLPATAG
ncbi:MAG: tRNA (adenosine(37)-N6)-dimethylallyltransferase MiaA, partial [Victivallales bacterium]|nr:tRNA (adenosine(37)-N6)-dimethylallyltransferase MiaA [Victivallales bacterium]